MIINYKLISFTPQIFFNPILNIFSYVNNILKDYSLYIFKSGFILLFFTMRIMLHSELIHVVKSNMFVTEFTNVN
jgi:hypothetical protein